MPKTYQQQEREKMISEIPKNISEKERSEWMEFINDINFIDIDETGEAGAIMPVNIGMVKRGKK